MHDVQLRSLLSLPVMALVLATWFFSGCKQGGPEGTLAVTGSVRSRGTDHAGDREFCGQRQH